MKVLALSSYPIEAAATRFRVGQYVGPLAEQGVEIDVRPFLSRKQFRSLYSGSGVVGKVAGTAASIARRTKELASASRYDLLFVQREAMPFGPGMFERLFQSIGRMPMVLDLDDATYVRYVSPTYGKLGSALKFFGKTDKLIDRSAVVICGNRYVAEYVEGRGKRSVVIPTIVDTDVFCPIEKDHKVPVIGWIGTHSTFQFLEPLFPVFTKLRAKHQFRLRIVGSGRHVVEVPGVDVEVVDWSLKREVSDFQSLDIGLYPLDTRGSLDPAWLAGKSGFKAIQYLAVGIPFVMSPIGVCADIGEASTTHFNAASDEDWYNSLDKLLTDKNLRSAMGAAGRAHSVAMYDLEKYAAILADTLRAARKDR
ncbi:MAG: glycosyltransferase family 4 protein [bacterium]|nr:glycosyltransferase family 4 protein [bacterium]